MRTVPLGVQLIVFSKQGERYPNSRAILEAVARSGFTAIETGVGALRGDPDGYCRDLASLGLSVCGFHGGVTADLDETFWGLEQVGARDLCVSSMGGYGNTIAANLERDLETFAAMADTCATHGVALHYHNHAYEFEPTDRGDIGMDLILAALAKMPADLCVDVAWVHLAGLDPVAFLRQHANLVSYVHLKDYDGDRHWLPLGAGVVPLHDVVACLPELPALRCVAVEQDTSDLPAEESCARSRAFLRGLQPGW